MLVITESAVSKPLRMRREEKEKSGGGGGGGMANQLTIYKAKLRRWTRSGYSLQKDPIQ